MVGDRLRELRIARNLALTDVASELHVSVATLSRIERGKQTLDLGMFLQLARILETPPQEILSADQEGNGSDGDPIDPLARRIAALKPGERTQLWRELSQQQHRNGKREPALNTLTHQIEELCAHVEFLRDELEEMRKRMKARRSSN